MAKKYERIEEEPEYKNLLIEEEKGVKLHFFSLDSIFDPHVGEKTAKILAREKRRRMVPKPKKPKQPLDRPHEIK